MTPPADAGRGPTLRDLGLTLEGSRLEALVAEFRRELARVGLAGLNPEFVLATEWGVPFPSHSIGIPFYLARADLTAEHATRAGLVEGETPADILRYLRHEMGHVVNYAYKLYEREDWTRAFGPFGRPYLDDYNPRPFSTSFVRHLPGWYAQKHPDEDWAETFAVWMTPGHDWRREYAGWPVALGKLEYCERVLAAVAGTPSLLGESAPDDDGDEDEFGISLDEYYGTSEDLGELPGLDGAIRTAFEDMGSGSEAVPVSRLVRAVETDIVANVFRWTGHFPERTRPLLRLIARRADELGQVYPAGGEMAAAVALTTLVAALAMNHVYRGEYFPAAEDGD